MSPPVREVPICHECPLRRTCAQVCAYVEVHLPSLEAGRVDHVDLERIYQGRIMTQALLDNMDILTPRQREVVQLYVGDPQAAVARPARELKGFAALALAAGEERRVTFTLTARDLSYWSSVERRWVLEGGEFTIDVGASSRDIRLSATVTIGEPPPGPAQP